jgi:transposase-like protein
MATFNEQTAYTQIIEPRYAARNAEVAAGFLTIALSAATAKAKIKVDRKRTNAAFIPFGNNNTQANIVANRNDILGMFSVDGEVKEIK